MAGKKNFQERSTVVRMFRIWTLFILVVTVLWGPNGTTASASEKKGMKMEIKRLFPLKMGDYQSDGKDEFYDRQTAFRYMDGAAEIYRSYGFKLLMVRRYKKANHPPLIVEIFDMGTSEDAFGIFSYETGDEEVGIGQGSDFGGGFLRFWKGKFFIHVYAEQETPFTQQDILSVGRMLADSIHQQGEKPKWIHLLPKENLLERSIRYFHHPQSLNAHYFVSHQNILHLGPQTPAFLSTYVFETKEKTFLLLIQYPSQKKAEEGLQSFIKAYMPESMLQKAVQTENKKWTAAKGYRNYVIVVFDAPTLKKAEELIQATQRNIERGPS